MLQAETQKIYSQKQYFEQTIAELERDLKDAIESADTTERDSKLAVSLSISENLETLHCRYFNAHTRCADPIIFQRGLSQGPQWCPPEHSPGGRGVGSAGYKCHE